MRSKLTPFQHEVLSAFFARENRFFLTGGAALAGFYLGHRETLDLDLFVTENALDDGQAVLVEVARELGAEIEKIQSSPDFRRSLLRRGEEALLVDLVVDRASQGDEDKPVFGSVRCDPPRTILANKLCTLLSRGEPRDLVDVAALERAGYRVEDALELAQEKDRGLTPAQLAWVLSEVSIGDDARIPGGMSVAALRTYLGDLLQRLSRLAFPE